MILAMIPGDARQDALGDLLRADGHETPAYCPGLEADWWIFPLPTGTHPLLGTLRPGSRVLAGGVTGRWPNLRLRDYYASETVQVMNAAITAEGAIGEAIRASSGTLWDSDALILGYGRIGQALAARLRGLGCRVTVYARREESRAMALCAGCRTLADPEEAAGFDFLFNTVPEPVLPAAPRETLCLELASKPGGFLDRRGVLPCPGLPGKTAPLTAARVLKASIDRILKEESPI